MSTDDVDYVSGNEVVDYTADDDVAEPAWVKDDSSAEDEVIDIDILPGMTDKDIAKNTFRQIPPGTHIVEVSKVEIVKSPEGDPNIFGKFYVNRNGKVIPIDYMTKKVNTYFNLIGDEKCQARDNFMLPMKGDAREGFEHGWSGDNAEANAIKNDRSYAGFWAKKLKMFLTRLGFELDDKGLLPAEAASLRNWVYYPGTNIKRRIQITIKPGKQRKPYLDSKTNELVTPQIYPMIDMSAYHFVPPPLQVMAGTPTQQAMQAAKTEAAKPVTQTAPVESASATAEPTSAKNGGKRSKIQA